MPAWNGKPPADKGGGGNSMLPPGTYTATIRKVEGTTGFDGDSQAEITYEVEGQGTIRQWVPVDIEDAAAKGVWIFWKLMGALDYPTVEYWEQGQEDRESREWNPLQDLRDCSDSGRTILLVVEQYEKKGGGTGTRVAASKLASPRRNPGMANQTGPKEPAKPEGFITKDDVPF